jgi:uncharacterized protein (UPF0248 family)
LEEKKRATIIFFDENNNVKSISTIIIEKNINYIVYLSNDNKTANTLPYHRLIRIKEEFDWDEYSRKSCNN